MTDPDPVESDALTPSDWERRAILAALGPGVDPEGLRDLVAACDWIPAHFTDPRRRTVAAVALSLVKAGKVADALSVVEALTTTMAAAWDHPTAVDVVCQPDLAAELGHQTPDLAQAVYEVARAALRRRLLTLSIQLEKRNGVERVRLALVGAR